MWTKSKRGVCTGLVALGVLAASEVAAQSPDPDAPPTTTSPTDPAPPTEPSDPSDQTYPTPPPTTPESTPPPDVDVNVQPPPAEPTVVVPPPPPPTTVVVDDDEYDDRPWIERAGIAIAIGGGVSGFTGDEMRDTTDDGGAWNVRVTLGSNSPLAFEGSYIGTAQDIQALGLDNDAFLLGNGAQGAVRLNFTRDLAVQPFVYGGAAWMRYELTNADVNTSDISNDDDVIELPVGAGVSLRSGGFLIDVRGEFRYVTEEDLVPALDTGGDPAEMHRYGANANVGFEF